MGKAGSKEGEEVCVSDGVGWVGLVKVKLRRRMDVYDCRSEGEAVTTLETDKTCWKLQGRRCVPTYPCLWWCRRRACRTNAR